MKSAEPVSLDIEEMKPVQSHLLGATGNVVLDVFEECLESGLTRPGRVGRSRIGRKSFTIDDRVHEREGVVDRSANRSPPHSPIYFRQASHRQCFEKGLEGLEDLGEGCSFLLILKYVKTQWHA